MEFLPFKFQLQKHNKSSILLSKLFFFGVGREKVPLHDRTANSCKRRKDPPTILLESSSNSSSFTLGKISNRFYETINSIPIIIRAWSSFPKNKKLTSFRPIFSLVTKDLNSKNLGGVKPKKLKLKNQIGK